MDDFAVGVTLDLFCHYQILYLKPKFGVVRDSDAFYNALVLFQGECLNTTERGRSSFCSSYLLRTFNELCIKLIEAHEGN